MWSIFLRLTPDFLEETCRGWCRTRQEWEADRTASLQAVKDWKNLLEAFTFSPSPNIFNRRLDRHRDDFHKLIWDVDWYDGAGSRSNGRRPRRQVLEDQKMRPGMTITHIASSIAHKGTVHEGLLRLLTCGCVCKHYAIWFVQSGFSKYRKKSKNESLRLYLHWIFTNLLNTFNWIRSFHWTSDPSQKLHFTLIVSEDC